MLLTDDTVPKREGDDSLDGFYDGVQQGLVDVIIPDQEGNRPGAFRGDDGTQPGLLAEKDQVFVGLRDASFQVVSISTTTGFATRDTTLWPHLSVAVLIDRAPVKPGYAR